MFKRTSKSCNHEFSENMLVFKGDYIFAGHSSCFFPLPTILLTLVVTVETAEISTLFPQFFSEPGGCELPIGWE